MPSTPTHSWHADHVNFLRILDFLEVEVRAFRDGAHPDYELMRDIIYYLGQYSDRYHHPREDAAFGCLAARDLTMLPAVHRMQHEHRVIAEAGRILLGYLDDILGDAIFERTRVEAAAAMYLLYYRLHIDFEETEIIPAARDLFTREDWAEVAATVPSAADPLSGGDADPRYRNLRRRILQ